MGNREEKSEAPSGPELRKLSEMRGVEHSSYEIPLEKEKRKGASGENRKC